MTVDQSGEARAARRTQIVELTRLGHSAAQIAGRLGITARSVQRGRVAAGLAATQPPRFCEAEYRAAKRMLDDGASYHEVGRTLGRAASTVKRHLPGYTWDKHQAAHAAALGRAMARLDRRVAA